MRSESVQQQQAQPGIVWIKLAVWVVHGFAVLLPYRRPALARPLFLLYPVLGGLAAWAAVYKPG